MKIDYTGQTVLVTGATRGIGQQSAHDMAQAGATLIITGTNIKPVIKVNRNFYPTRPLQYPVDFLDDESVDGFLDFLSDKKVDVLINNAGINTIAPVANVNDSDWNDIIKVNLTAPYRIIKAVSESMVEQKYGKIVNIGSIWGTIGKEQRVCYSASKFGLRGVTAATAAELARYGVLINTVSPGFTLTELTQRILGEEQMADLSNQIPVGRMAEPEEISKVVLFMASTLNSYISGQNIVVDGGFINV